ncbi:MAG: hypothetical protein ACTHNY_07440 [Solirubrobacterales bacterium]
MVEVAQEVPIQAEKDEDSAFSTFLSPAPEMPSFTADELAKSLDKRWQRRTASLFRALKEEAPGRD